jgi:hypothetical protein
MLAVEPFEEDPIVLVARHDLIRVSHPAIRAAAVGVGLVLSGDDGHDQDFKAVAKRETLDIREGRRVDLTKFLGDLFERAVAHLLSDNLAVSLDAEEDLTAAVIEHRADRMRGLASFPGRALELDGLGFAGGDKGYDLICGHDAISQGLSSSA